MAPIENALPETWSLFPAAWRAELESNLAAAERPLAWFEPDLNESLRYAAGLVVLTDKRLISFEPSVEKISSGSRRSQATQDWALAEGVTLRTDEHAGLGTLELLGPTGRVSIWRYTAGNSAAANRLAQRFNALLLGKQTATDGEPAEPAAVCPECGAVLPHPQAECPSCSPPAAAISSRSLFRLLTFAKRRGGMLTLGFLLLLLTTSASLVSTYLTRPLIDDGLRPEPPNWVVIKWCLGGLFVSSILSWLLGWARTYVLCFVSEQISYDLRNATYAHLQRLSLEFFGGKRTGDLISRVGSDTDKICQFLSVNLLDFASDVLLIAMTSVILLTIDPLLALFTLLPLPFIAWLIQRCRHSMRHGFNQEYRVWGEMVSVLADTIPGIRVVKAFAQESREIERFRRANQIVLDTNNKVNKTWAFLSSTLPLFTELGLLVVWAWGAWRVGSQQITVGVLIVFVAYIGRFYVRLDSMSRFIASIQRAAAAAQRIFEILDRVPSVPEPVRPVHPGRVEGSIELRHVNFRYGTRPVLRDVNISIRPGEMIGLVGPSGAGKSTLVNLVCRFFDVVEGAILVDGEDIRSFPVEEYRQNIGIVLQDPFLFYGTIAENIAYARPGASREQIIEAARAARAHEFILRLTDGYDSVVGERGQSLSGGERQRISIARALLTDPRILILDEATSSVDTETEREIQEALDNLVRGRTTIAIAHRLSTLRRADRLVVLERGQIAEIGGHAELLAKSGTYARLHKAQLELAQSVGI